MSSSKAIPMTRGLNGTIHVPGDKSISHRALMLGAVAEGQTSITGMQEGADVLNTVEALRALGISIVKEGAVWRVQGRPFQTPLHPIDFGNSGTSARLLMGLLAGHPVSVTFTGDASLRRRPMKRVTEPLAQMGARFEGETLPLKMTGGVLNAIDYAPVMASAQVKSALLLATLRASGTTTITEPRPTRDHTEKMLRLFGADIISEGTTITMKGRPRLEARSVSIPADPSAAAFPLVAALLIPESDVIVPNVLINPLRIGLYITLIEMGADISFENRREMSGEPVADIRARYSPLMGVVVPEERVPSMIDEFPILAIAAAFAEGETIMSDLAELRVKESDRLASIAAGLTAAGVRVEVGQDNLCVYGCGAGIKVRGGCRVETHLDHRIAMSFLTLGLAAEEPVFIDHAEMMATSFPDFEKQMKALGATIL